MIGDRFDSVTESAAQDVLRSLDDGQRFWLGYQRSNEVGRRAKCEGAQCILDSQSMHGRH